MEIASLAHLFAFDCSESSITVDCSSICWLLGEGQGGDPDPGGTSERHEDGRHEIGIVVAEAGDGGRRCKGTSSTSDLVEDMHRSIHATKAVDVPSNDIGRTACASKR